MLFGGGWVGVFGYVSGSERGAGGNGGICGGWLWIGVGGERGRRFLLLHTRLIRRSECNSQERHGSVRNSLGERFIFILVYSSLRTPYDALLSLAPGANSQSGR
jgi:hypothetical protein